MKAVKKNEMGEKEMGNSLQGKRIVLGASRKTEEMSTLIEKQGGIPSIRSLQGIVYKAEEDVKNDLLNFVDNGADWVIFTTGIGFQTLVELADELGVKENFIQRVKQAKVAVRGYKTVAALKKHHIPFMAEDDDGTTQGLIRQLADFSFTENHVIIQLHGEKAPSLIQYLENKGAKVSTILPYQHTPPEEEVVEKLCQEVILESVDAICFTTAIQVRSLFDYAREKGYLEALHKAFSDQTVATAVGKVTAEALKEEGIERVVVPNHERMGAMVVELGKFFEDTK